METSQKKLNFQGRVIPWWRCRGNAKALLACRPKSGIVAPIVVNVANDPLTFGYFTALFDVAALDPRDLLSGAVGVAFLDIAVRLTTRYGLGR